MFNYDELDPYECVGQWVVTTATGARHVVTNANLDVPVTVERLARGVPNPTAERPLATLRRDGHPLALHGVEWLESATGETGPGVRVGMHMVLLIEPLGDDVEVTQRTTSRVHRIEHVWGD